MIIKLRSTLSRRLPAVQLLHISTCRTWNCANSITGHYITHPEPLGVRHSQSTQGSQLCSCPLTCVWCNLLPLIIRSHCRIVLRPALSRWLPAVRLLHVRMCCTWQCDNRITQQDTTSDFVKLCSCSLTCIACYHFLSLCLHYCRIVLRPVLSRWLHAAPWLSTSVPARGCPLVWWAGTTATHTSQFCRHTWM
jgi:hypothetical protein